MSNEMITNDDTLETFPDTNRLGETESQADVPPEHIIKLQRDFEARLVAANLRTEAVRAGMVDLDGLKLIDPSALKLDGDDKVVGGRKLMDDLRRSKPWLFGSPSSSSPATAPNSQPVKQKLAMEMTDQEYLAARLAITKYRL